MKRLFAFIVFSLMSVMMMVAQRITGHVSDAKSGEAAPFVNVFYEGTREGVQTDIDGNFSISYRAGRKLTVSCVGYETYSVKPAAGEKLDIRLQPLDLSFGEAKVVGKKTKYSRKNNPAVELMKKVIAAKKYQDLKQHDYYKVEQYNKLNFALADVTPKVFEEGKFKRMPFLKDHVELSPESGKLILPLTVEETVTSKIYRKSDDTEKDIIVGKREEGINELINTGEIITQMLNDFFTEINLYEDNVRLLQYQFISPLSAKDGIAFYRYFIADTTYIDGAKCIEVQFTPNNSQDFGFSGELYVIADSTYRVKRVSMGVPVHTGVNFVDLMKIEQVYDRLPSGEQVLISDRMLLVMKIVKKGLKLQARRVTDYTDFSFDSIPDIAFRIKGKSKFMADAQMKDEMFWEKHRSEELTQSETRVSLFLDRLQNMKGFKPIIWVGKAFIENFVETTLDPKKGSKIDYGPVNTTITHSDVDGLRLRASLLSTANLSPHLFFKGYVAYGFKDEKWKGSGEVTYSFNKKKYLPREYPVRNLTFSYTNDVMSPSDVHLPTDKDNVFVALKWSKVDHMMYNENFRLFYEQEWENGLRALWKFSHDRNEPTSALFYQPVANGKQQKLDDGTYSARPFGVIDLAPGTSLIPEAGDATLAQLNRRYLTTTDFTFSFQWQPGAEFLNPKQRRILVNKDAPLFAISHTVGVKGVWSDVTYNNTEVEVYKRWWVKSWGKIDARLKAGAQWNKVPFPLLCAPWANTSYIREDNMFMLIKNMEFLNDRYVSLMTQWDLNGKILNRIPLIRRLKWREYFGVNCLWGYLTDGNNPYLEKNRYRTDIYYFPSRFNPATGAYQQQTQLMDPKKPYVEAFVGIHNIFKILWIQYVHRFTYVNDASSIYGDTQRWGIRFMLRATF